MLISKSPLLLLALLTASLLGCGALAQATDKPKVEVQSVSLSSAGFTGIRGELAMSIYNPNSFGLPLSRVEWTLSVGRAQAVSGAFDLSETIAAKASTPVVGSLNINLASAVAVGQELAAGVTDYTIRGRLHFQTQFGNLSVDIAGQGDIRSL